MANIVFLGVMNLILWIYINNPKHNLAEGITKGDKKYFAFRAVTVPLVFIFMADIYLTVNKEYAVWIPLTIPIVMRIFKKLYFKKAVPV